VPHDVTVAEADIDNDISATSGRRRPEYERMIADIQEFRRDGVLAGHLDRLHRHPNELEQFIVRMKRPAPMHERSRAETTTSRHQVGGPWRVSWAHSLARNPSKEAAESRFENVNGHVTGGGFPLVAPTDSVLNTLGSSRTRPPSFKKSRFGR
jgi:hypothetical protein